MAEALALNSQASAMLLLRQAGVLVALAASVALGLYVVLWARAPDYTVLYTDLAERDLAQVVDALQSNQIPYRMDPRGGAILVAADKVHDARLRLAAAGLPRSASMGFELLETETGFGTSQFLEQARYQRAIEGELSRSIGHINNVRAARVHLAVPKQTAFSRTRRDPTASVIVDLYNGRRLEAHQVGAIVHMVSASVPGLSPERVAVIDQQGSLLTDGRGGNDELAVSVKRFEHTRRLEQSYIERIEAIVMPLVGPDGVRAQVTADIDYTATEQTRESFNPDPPAVRSESLLEEERRGSGPGGIPGALSNEPPVAATAPETLAEAAPGAAEDDEQTAASRDNQPGNRRSQTTRNYELDRTISHTRPAVGTVRRLSVAVVVRNPAAAPEASTTTPAAGDAAISTAAPGLDAAELERIERLVKEAVGFDAERGDSVSVTSADFHAPPAPEPLPATPLWERPWIWSVGKQVLGGLFALFVLFGVIRPAVKSLMARPAGSLAAAHDGARAGEVLSGGGQRQLGGDGERAALLPGQAGSTQPLLASSEVDPNIDQVKQFVAQDPKIAAQVIKGWVSDN
ncbi:MAG: flagellar basal-body MS-ring/collar protein FliF [Gammaproteobacteria bacterium]